MPAICRLRRMRRRSRAFTLIELSVVVALIGILSVLAVVAYRKWVRNAYVNEATEMLSNIRSAEETVRAETGGYIDVSGGLAAANLYPSTTPAGDKKTAWGADCTSCKAPWTSIHVVPSGAVRFGYAVTADNATTTSPTGIKSNDVAVDTSALVGQPWYAAVAICDVASDGVTPDTTIYTLSLNNQFYYNDVGQ
jgi:prepilin-type N-terminal cleavage/methylation domain-containing protein